MGCPYKAYPQLVGSFPTLRRANVHIGFTTEGAEEWTKETESTLQARFTRYHGGQCLPYLGAAGITTA